MRVTFGLFFSRFGVVGVRIVLVLVLAAIQVCVYRAAARMSASLAGTDRLNPRMRAGINVFFAAVNLPLLEFVIESLFSPRRLLIYSPPHYLEGVIRPVSIIFFVWTVGSFLFVVASPIGFALLAAYQFLFRRGRLEAGTSLETVDLSRRRFLHMALAGAAAVPFAAAAYGAVAARAGRTVERVVVKLKGLPPDLDGFRIVQLTDIHSGMFMGRAQMSEYVRVANSLAPDLVALTGDFVASKASEVAPFFEAFSGLKARRGVFGCLGNHDMFTGSERAIEAAFTKAGFKLLRGQNEYIRVGRATLNVIGIDFIDPSSHKYPTVQKALSGVPLDGTTLLLSHNPNTFPQAAKAGIDLMLAGHTHGGQIALTIGDLIITPARLATVFIAGLFKIADSHLYVSRGLGTTGPPIRINAPPEITEITLRRSGG